MPMDYETRRIFREDLREKVRFSWQKQDTFLGPTSLVVQGDVNFVRMYTTGRRA